MNKNISAHLSYNEVIKSNSAIKAGINNEPDSKALANIIVLAEKVFEPLRIHFGKPIGISSGYRSIALNKLIKGANSSQHTAGSFNGRKEAAFDIDSDIYDNGLTNTQIFEYIKDKLPFDQLIAEFESNGEPGWIHVSYSQERMRKQVLIASKYNGKTLYSAYTKELYNKIYGK